MRERLHSVADIGLVGARDDVAPELEGDEAFQAGMISAAIAKYSKAIAESPR